MGAITTEQTQELKQIVYVGKRPAFAHGFKEFPRGVVETVTADEQRELLVADSGFREFEPEGWYIGSNSEIESSDVALLKEFLTGISESRRPRILFMRDMGAGDVMMSVPTVRAVKQEYPTAHITYATLPRNMAVLNEVSAIDEVISTHDLKLDSECGYDLIVNWSRAVEWYGIKRNRLHRVDAFATHVGITLPETDESHALELHLSESDILKAVELIPDWAIGKTLVGYVVQAVGWNRTYPVWRVREIIRKITAAIPNSAVVLIDSQIEAAEIFEGMSGVVNLCGKTESFMEAAVVVAMCDVVIAPDSGLAHVAGALNKPSVVLCAGIPSEVRYKHYPRTKAITGDVDCFPCWDWQDKYKEGDKRGKPKSCMHTRVVKCLESIKPTAIVEAVAEILHTEYIPENELTLVTEYRFASHVKADSVLATFVIPACANDDTLEINTALMSDISIKLNSINCELIVIANGCCPEYIEYLKENKIKHVELAKRTSYSRACNIGAENATSDTVCFMNSDVVINDTKTIVECANRIKERGIGAIGFEGMRLNHTWCGDGILAPDDREFDFLVGWCVWTCKDVLRRAGGWDERYSPYYSEDADMSFKIKHSLGLTIEYCQTDEVKHLGGATINNIDGKQCSNIAMRSNADKLADRWWQSFRPRKGFVESVAIIIPAHVKREYLVECLDSVRESGLSNQVVYVGLDRMQFPEWVNYKDVRFFNLDFGHPGATRNFLVSESVEPYIYFFDADDILISGSVPRLLNHMKSGGFDVVYGRAKIVEQSNNHWFGNIDANGYLNTREFNAGALRYGNYISTQSLVRRSALPSCAPFDTEFPALEDWDLWLTMLETGASFSMCDVHLWDYRIHETNLTRDSSKNVIANKLLRKKHGFDIGRIEEVVA